MICQYNAGFDYGGGDGCTLDKIFSTALYSFSVLFIILSLIHICSVTAAVHPAIRNLER